jgi:hypothetical protein
MLQHKLQFMIQMERTFTIIALCSNKMLQLLLTLPLLQQQPQQQRIQPTPLTQQIPQRQIQLLLQTLQTQQPQQTQQLITQQILPQILQSQTQI